MYENNTAAVKVEIDVSCWFCIKSGVKQGCVLSPFIWFILMDFVLRSTGKAMGDHGIKWGGKSLLDLYYVRTRENLGFLLHPKPNVLLSPYIKRIGYTYPVTCSSPLNET